MSVAWYDSYASIQCTLDPSHILWKVRSPKYVWAFQCSILYRHEISCRLSDVHAISCQDVYVKAKGFMPTRHRKPFWYFISNSSLVVCRPRVLTFEPCDVAALCCPGSVCAPANGWLSIQSEQTEPGQHSAAPTQGSKGKTRRLQTTSKMLDIKYQKGFRCLVGMKPFAFTYTTRHDMSW